MLFVITYSRVNIVRNTLTGECFHSNVDRPKKHRDLLARHGPEIYILRLQGFIFFGTIQAVLNQIRGRPITTRGRSSSGGWSSWCSISSG